MFLLFRRAEEIKSVTAEVVPVEDRSKEVEALQKKVDNLNRLLEGKVNEVVDVQKQLNVSCFYNGPATSVVNLNTMNLDSNPEFRPNLGQDPDPSL